MPFLELTGHTWLDLLVNIIPMGILLVLDMMFIVYNPWGWDLFYVAMAHFLTLFPFVLLGILTYISGLTIQRDEERLQDPDEMTGPREAS